MIAGEFQPGLAFRTTMRTSSAMATRTCIPTGPRQQFRSASRDRAGTPYLCSHTQVDAQASFQMHRGLHLIVAGLNLSNEVFGFYNGSSIYPIQREYYKPNYIFGLCYTLSNEPK